MGRKEGLFHRNGDDDDDEVDDARDRYDGVQTTEQPSQQIAASSFSSKNSRQTSAFNLLPTPTFLFPSLSLLCSSPSSSAAAAVVSQTSGSEVYTFHPS